jgi:rare lipoprotein A
MRSGRECARGLAIGLVTFVVGACATVQEAPAQRGWDGKVKIGQPYQVNGVWYYPKDDPAYDATGLASWYGAEFHDRHTANGETFDKNAVSAAHPTLPMPSFVEVTNLATGRVLTIRINDRGPFKSNRVIDLSRRAAQLLGFEDSGLAKVRVRRVYPKEAPEVQALPPPVVVASNDDRPLEEIPAAVPAGEMAVTKSASTELASLPAPPALTGAIYVQVAALREEGTAQWLAGDVRKFAPSKMDAKDGWFRVRLGPFLTRSAAETVLAQVREAGYPDAHVVQSPKNDATS